VHPSSGCQSALVFCVHMGMYKKAAPVPPGRLINLDFSLS